MMVLRRFATQALDTLFPPRCFACNTLTAEQGNLCAACWAEVEFIAAPYCRRCGTPFAHALEGADECMDCLLHPPIFDAARAVFCYEGGSRRLITGYKYHDRTIATPMFARWLARAAAEQLRDTDAIVPVPLHRWRLLQRRYNQSALLARGLGRLCGIPCLAGALHRTRHTPQQAGLTREARIQNVQGAFTVHPHCLSQIDDKSIMLVDDVFTTGATLNACAQVLRQAGAKKVYIVTLARTVKEE